MELSFLAKNTIVYMSAKRQALLDQRDQIQSLVLGSSHGDYGFNPEYCGGSFNLCSRSQDLKYAWHLYQKIGPNLPDLKNLVIFYSVFSPGSFLEKSPSEASIGPVLNEIFDLGLHYEEMELARIAAFIEGQLNGVAYEIEGKNGFCPGFSKTMFDDAYGVQLRADQHMRLNRKTDANVYLMQIFLLAKELGHTPYIVIPPARKDYKQACGAEFETLFSDLIEIMGLVDQFHPDLRATLVNLYDDEDFQYEHFGDFDHLQPYGDGPKILARKILHTLNQI